MADASMPCVRVNTNFPAAPMTIPLPSAAVFIATLLSVHGLRKGSLSPNGALTAFFVGYLSFSGGSWVFGAALTGFYLAGSRATKCKRPIYFEHSSAHLLKTGRNKRPSSKMATRKRGIEADGKSSRTARLRFWQPSSGTLSLCPRVFTQR